MDKFTFEYEKRKLNIDVIYRNRKSISLRIIPKEKIEVIAPIKTSKKAIEDLLKKHSNWIEDKLNEFKNYDENLLSKEYVQGESFFYLGDIKKLKIIKDKNINNKKNYVYIELKGENIEIRTNNCDRDYLRQSLKKWYKLQSENIVMDRITYLRQNSLNFRKINPSLVKVKEQKKIWGSCNFEGKIYLNSRLAMLPVEAIDYIIVHEFCHITYLNHSKEFYKLVESILPNYKDITKWLNKNNYKFIL